jgi:hypothetical protein
VTEEPPHRNPSDFRPVYANANAGTASAPAFGHVVFGANDALTEAVGGIAPKAPEIGAAEQNLYEWAEGQLRLVNVLPGNAEAATGAVVGSGRLLGQAPAFEAPDVDHAISEDGSRIFWSEPSGQVYARIDGEKTQKIEDLGSPGSFVTASADGSKVLLSDGCLYDLDEEECEADLAQGQGEKFRGILGAAEDLSRIYFVDTAVLTGGEENGNEEQAEVGKFNLYAWHAGATAFIGILLGEDNEVGGGEYGAWHAARSNRTAQVEADGSYLAFMSKASLTGYDNNPSGGGVCNRSQTAPETSVCFEVFVYEAATASLICASCNLTGQRPLGPSRLSLIKVGTKRTPFRQPGNLSAAGQGRLFFESEDALSPQDTNGPVNDVYGWEPNGIGSCEREGGCVRLISSGRSPSPSLFVDSTPSGDDAFIVTREQLLPQDKNEQIDLYDVRVGGGIDAESETLRSECQGEACQPAAVVPNDPTPSSSAFSGSGNVKELAASKRRCPKGKRKVRRRGKARCVKPQRKHQADKPRHRRAAHTDPGGAK